MTVGIKCCGHSTRRGEAGFTLLELLIALMIFSLAFAASAHVAQTALRQSQRAEATVKATALAEATITRLGADLPLRRGELSGQGWDGGVWRAWIELAEPPAPGLNLALYRVTVEASVQPGMRPAALTTLRLGPAP